MKQIDINPFDTDYLLNGGKKLLLLGKTSCGKSYLLKDLIQAIRQPFYYGVVITDTKHLGFYDFLPVQWVYRKYSPLLQHRCFMDNMYLFLDSYTPSRSTLDQITYEMKDKNILFAITLKDKIHKYLIDFDYIFLFSKEYIEDIYYFVKDIIETRIFYETISNFFDISDKYEVLVVNCRAKTQEEIFFSYICED
ncbi:MAG TPA: hypothetical protein V6C58_03585 [Allocoleopsis sp.]